MGIFSIITVREGSQGIKNKCMRKIGSKAVFEYTVEYSMDLGNRLEGAVFTVMSSDSETAREYCSRNNIHFLDRSPLLASDVARIEDVVFDAYCQVGRSFDYISLLYGNIPVRYPHEFLRAYKFLEENEDYDAVISMQNVEKYNPAWMFKLNEDLLPVKQEEGYRRQDLQQFMGPDGHTVLFRTKHFLEHMERGSKTGIMYEALGKKIKPMLNDKLIIDIDTERDLKLAEIALRLRNASEELEK